MALQTKEPTAANRHLRPGARMGIFANGASITLQGRNFLSAKWTGAATGYEKERSMCGK
jgi:hypothetical protein